jgi:hypothetical protein
MYISLNLDFEKKQIFLLFYELSPGLSLEAGQIDRLLARHGLGRLLSPKLPSNFKIFWARGWPPLVLPSSLGYVQVSVKYLPTFFKSQ